MIDQKKIEYYNSVSQQYVEMLTVYDCEGFDDIVYEKDGGIAIPSENIVEMTSTQSDDNGNYVSVEYSKNGKLYVLSNDNCSIINRCVEDLFKSVRYSTTRANIQKEVYDWIILSKIGVTDMPLGNYIGRRLQEQTDTYTCYFRMPYVEIAGNGSLTVAGVKIGVCEELEQYWSKVEKAFVGDKAKEDVYALVTLSGEINRVKELAYEKAQMAVDIIKINSWLRFEYIPLLASMDIDRNIMGTPCTVALTHKMGEDRLNVEQVLQGQKYVIDASFITILKRSMMNLFATFMKNYYDCETHSELDEIIKRSISRYNKALSTQNKHERVVGFCSILDAIVLSDNEIGIKESLKKYVPILISNDLEQRKDLKKTINEMYEVRSQYIHHGKELGITTGQMSRYSGNVYCTLARLIQLRKEYKTIKEILSVVDNMMMGVLF